MRIEKIEQDLLVEDALRTFPLAEPPPGLAPAIRRRIRRMAPPRFHVSWVEAAFLLAAASLLGGFGLLLASLPPHLVNLAYVRLMVCWQQFHVRGLDSLLFAAAALLLLPALAGLVWALWPKSLERLTEG